jgi:erythromycin esterase
MQRIELLSCTVLLLGSAALAAPSAKERQPSRARATVRGLVENTGHEPLPGVLVSAYAAKHLAYDVRDPVAQARTDDRGRYVLPLPHGVYSLTAVAEEHAPRTVGKIEVLGRDVSAPPVQLAAGELSLAGVVRDPDGAPLAGARVSIGPAAERSSGVNFPVTTDEAGRYRVRLAPGAYIIVADHPRFTYAQRFVVLEAERTLDFTMRGPVSAWSPSALRAQLENALIPLRHVSASEALDDLERAREVFASATVVGLGEANHGSHEIFLLKHRLFRFLVERLGFMVLAFECGIAEAEAIDAYLQTGQGDPAKLLAELGYWTWDTEEVLGVIVWMRRYNEIAEPERRLRFAGIDAYGTERYAREVRRILATVDATAATRFATTLDLLASSDAATRHERASDAERRALVDDVRRIEVTLVTLEDRVKHAGGEHAWRRATTYARNLRQLTEAMAAKGLDAMQRREVLMAENAAALTNEPGAKVAIWAHNEHLWLDDTGGDYLSLGAHLRRRLGDRYVSVATMFDRGTFRARDRRHGGPPGKVVDVTLGAAPAWSIEGFLAQSRRSLFVLDLRRLPPDLNAFLHTEVKGARGAGAVFTAESYLVRALVPADIYDVVLFMDRVTPSVPTPTGRARGERAL